MHRLGHVLSILLLSVAACSGDSSPGNGSDAGDGDGDGSHGDGDHGDGDTQSPPILSRSSSGDYACSVEQDLVTYPKHMWRFNSVGLSPLGEGALLSRFEAIGATNMWDLGAYSLLVSPISAAGELGAATQIPVTNIDQTGALNVLALDEGRHALAWVEDAKMFLAILDADHKLSFGPSVLVEDGVQVSDQLRLSRHDSGRLAVVFINTDQQVQIVTVDDDGSNASTPFTLSDGQARSQPEIVAVDDGFTLLFSQVGDDNQRPPQVFFAKIDVKGVTSHSRKQISNIKTGAGSRAIGFASSRVALIKSGSELLAAWSESHEGDNESASGAYSIIRLQKLDTRGERIGESVLLRNKQLEVDDVEPGLLTFRDSVAVSWAPGSHIYICGGCVPDHQLSAVLIDPVTLTPKSNVVSLTPEIGGFLRRQLVASGDRLLSTVEITFHTWSQPGFAAIRCQ